MLGNSLSAKTPSTASGFAFPTTPVGGPSPAGGGGGSAASFVIPWDVWEAQVSVGTLAKSIVSRVSDPRRRVSESAKQMGVSLALAHRVGFQALCKSLFAGIAGATTGSGATAGSTAGSGGGAGGTASHADLLRVMLQQLGRLKLLHELLLSPLVASGDQPLPLEALLGFLSTCLRSHSTAVWHVAKCCAEAMAAVLPLQSSESAAAVQAFMDTVDASTRAVLQRASSTTSDAHGGGGSGGSGLFGSGPGVVGERLGGGGLVSSYSSPGLLHTMSPVRASPVVGGVDPASRTPALFTSSHGNTVLAPLSMSGPLAAVNNQRKLRQTGSAGPAGFHGDGSGVGPVERRVLAGRRAASAKVRQVFG